MQEFAANISLQQISAATSAGTLGGHLELSFVKVSSFWVVSQFALQFFVHEVKESCNFWKKENLRYVRHKTFCRTVTLSNC